MKLNRLVTCLKEAFLKDPHINWYLLHTTQPKLTKRCSRYDIFMIYNIYHAYLAGFIVQAPRQKGVGLFIYPKRFFFSFKFHILISLKMLYVFGFVNVFRILKLQKQIHKKQGKKPFLHLLLLGVRNKYRKRGIGRQIVEYGIHEAKKLDVPFLLETSTQENVRYYQSLGFVVYDTLESFDNTGLVVYFLRYNS